MIVAAGLGLLELPFSGAEPFWRWVELCEEGGVDSLWQSDRLVSREPFLECMSAMAAIAGATRRIKFGMSVASVALRDPVLLAKQCATIDMLSGGRLLPAFGIGSPFSPDWEATGTPTKGRGKRTDEALEVIARLWRGETVSFEGEHFRFRDLTISPLPVQRRLPLWIGGSSPAAIRRTARIGTGWLGGPEGPAEAGRVVAGIKAACEETGRRVPDDHYGASFLYRFGRGEDAVVERYVARAERRRPDRDPRTSLVTGDADAIMDRVRAFVDVGVTKFVLRPMGADDEDVIGQTRLFIDEIIPAIDELNRERRAAPC